MSRPDEIADRLEERRMDGWRELKTLQEVAAAQAAGEEIEYTYASKWVHWHMEDWQETTKYRSRQKKRTKKIVMREALLKWSSGYEAKWVCESNAVSYGNFVRWLDTPERVIEVEE